MTAFELAQPDLHGWFQFSPVIRPVDASSSITLPDPWPELIRREFHVDLLERARGFASRLDQLGGDMKVAGLDMLSGLGRGFLMPFQATEYILDSTDIDYELRMNALNALQGMSDYFGDRVSSLVWHTFAFMMVRPEPTERRTIISMQSHLPLPYWVADVVLHATGKVYGFKRHLDSELFLGAGVVTEHNCDCSHSIYPPDMGGMIVDCLPEDRVEEATAALFSHLLCESILLGGLGMPFNMGVSPEAAEAFALAGTS